MESTLRKISLEIPLTDLSLIEAIAQRMGWKMHEKKQPEITMSAEPEVLYSDRIKRIRGLKGTGITQSDIENDERLKYILNK